MPLMTWRDQGRGKVMTILTIDSFTLSPLKDEGSILKVPPSRAATSDEVGETRQAPCPTPVNADSAGIPSGENTMAQIRQYPRPSLHVDYTASASPASPGTTPASIAKSAFSPRPTFHPLLYRLTIPIHRHCRRTMRSTYAGRSARRLGL